MWRGVRAFLKPEKGGQARFEGEKLKQISLREHSFYSHIEQTNTNDILFEESLIFKYRRSKLLKIPPPPISKSHLKVKGVKGGEQYLKLV